MRFPLNNVFRVTSVSLNHGEDNGARVGNCIAKAGQRFARHVARYRLIYLYISERKRRNRETTMTATRERNGNVAFSIYGHVCQSRQLFESRKVRVIRRVSSTCDSNPFLISV